MEYGIIGQQPEGVSAVLRTADDKRLSDLIVLVEGREIGSIQRLRVNRPRKDGAGVASALRWCCFSRGWVPKDWGDPLFEGFEVGCQIGEGFGDRMEAAGALLKVWDEAGRPHG